MWEIAQKGVQWLFAIDTSHALCNRAAAELFVEGTITFAAAKFYETEVIFNRRVETKKEIPSGFGFSVGCNINHNASVINKGVLIKSRK